MHVFPWLVSSLVLLSAGVASAESEPLPAAEAARAASAEPAPDAAPWRLHASYDLGVLSFGGLGVHAGLAHGPWSAAAGFYRFESKDMFGGALGGFGDDFKLHVDFIAAAQLGYFFNGDTDRGWYATLIYHAKQQTVTERSSGADAVLVSHLVGPELGYVWNFFAGAFLRPRLGVLYYAKSPQPGRKPVEIGGVAYDNPTHTWIDAYITADLGYEFDL
jgi:hypothetical protein